MKCLSRKDTFSDDASAAKTLVGSPLDEVDISIIHLVDPSPKKAWKRREKSASTNDLPVLVFGWKME